MRVPAQITYRHVQQTPVISDFIQAQLEKLNLMSERITSCQIVLAYEAKQHETAQLFGVTINVSVPGKELISTHNHHEKIMAALGEAFEDMRRQLEDYVRIMQGRIKAHPPIIYGHVVRLFEGYGFIESADGEEYYFNKDFLTHANFERLRVGEVVHFIEQPGDEGMQARRVGISRRDARAA